jgi:hypothetical protein
LPRGQKNCVFTEDGNKYCCIGAQPGRAERGVQSGLYRLKNGLPSEEWDLLHKFLKRAEYAFDMDTNVIRHISYVMISLVLTVSTLPYQVFGQTDVRTTEPLAVIDPS